MDLSGKRTLVTGGSRGIGRAVAVAFAARGAAVAVNYRSDARAAEETLASLHGTGHLALNADVADPDQAESLVAAAVDGLGGLDILVNNAGIWIDHELDRATYDEWREAWRQVLDTNLVGPANVCYWAARHMMIHGGGKIVNVSSRGAYRGEPDGPAYGASKAGLNSLSQSLAKHLAPYGISVGGVAPGFVETDMGAPFLKGPEGEAIRNQSPMGRVARPEEVAQAVLFLAADGSEFSTGTVIDVNGASYLR